MAHLIARQHSLVIGFDGLSDLDSFKKIIDMTSNLEGVGAYKIDFSLGLRYGLAQVAACARDYTSKPLIYDHQCAGSGLSRGAADFASLVADADFQAVTLFPLADPDTQHAWTTACLERRLSVLSGGCIDHSKYVCSHTSHNPASDDMFVYAARLNVHEFVLQGSHPAVIGRLRQRLSHDVHVHHPVFFVAGFTPHGTFLEAVSTFTRGLSWHTILDCSLPSFSEHYAEVERYMRQLDS